MITLIDLYFDDACAVIVFPLSIIFNDAVFIIWIQWINNQTKQWKKKLFSINKKQNIFTLKLMEI